MIPIIMPRPIAMGKSIIVNPMQKRIPMVSATRQNATIKKAATMGSASISRYKPKTNRTAAAAMNSHACERALGTVLHDNMPNAMGTIVAETDVSTIPSACHAASCFVGIGMMMRFMNVRYV